MSFVTDWIYGAAFFWVEWVPGGWYGVNFVAGLILGALLGKPAVAALLAVGGALLFWRRNSPDAEQHEMVTHHPDKRPLPTRKPKTVNWQDAEIPRRKTAMERWIEGDQQ